jgi:glycosyltransferase involved in cell wall biosynthesis
VSTLSIIIPTVNAVAELDLALTSLAKNSHLDREIVVVVDPDLNTKKVNPKILAVCQKHHLTPLVNTRNLGPYGNWNKGAKHAKGEYLVFATDDQYFAPGWDDALLSAYQPKRLVAGQLVEPGIIPVWRTNIQADFGTTPADFAEADFITWCAKQSAHGFKTDGFFIPLLMHRRDFAQLGPYPTEGQFGTQSAVSNDDHFIKHALRLGYTFGTAQDSYSYHFQASSWKKKTLHPKIAALVLTYNEATDIDACLQSLDFVDHILVLDSGSTDDTVARAKKYPHVTVDTHVFTDYATQRNYGIHELQEYDWVLMIDADETVETPLRAELRSFAKDIYLDGVEIPRKNFIWGKWIEHSDWYPDHRLVYFRPKLVEVRGAVHERVAFIKGNGLTAVARAHLLHKNYTSVHEFVVKNLVTYPEYLAQAESETWPPLRAHDFIAKPLAEFFRRYFLCEGWRDGAHGLVLSVLMGIQAYLITVYMWEKRGLSPVPDLDQPTFKKLIARKATEWMYWWETVAITSSHGFKKWHHRLNRKWLKTVKAL